MCCSCPEGDGDIGWHFDVDAQFWLCRDPGAVGPDYSWEGWFFTGDGNTRRGLILRANPTNNFTSCYQMVIEAGLSEHLTQVGRRWLDGLTILGFEDTGKTLIRSVISKQDTDAARVRLWESTLLADDLGTLKPSIALTLTEDAAKVVANLRAAAAKVLVEPTNEKAREALMQALEEMKRQTKPKPANAQKP